MLLVRPDHPLATRGTTVRVEEILGCQWVLTPTTFGIGHAIQMLEYAEKIEIRPTVVSNSLAALKRLVASGEFASLVGEFAAYREIEQGHLAAIMIDHPLMLGVEAKLLVKSGRPLAAPAQELLRWMRERLPMFKPDSAEFRGDVAG